MHKIDGFIKIKKIEDLPVSYTAIATDLNSMAEVQFVAGKLIDAIRASIAIPSIFTPVFLDNHILLDGGLINNIPINHIPQNEYPVIAVCVNADKRISDAEMEIMDHQTELQHAVKLKKIKNHFYHYLKNKNSNDKDTIGYAELLDKSIHLMIGRASQQIIEKNPPDLLINISREICGTFDFLKAAKIIETGRLAAIKSLKDINI